MDKSPLEILGAEHALAHDIVEIFETIGKKLKEKKPISFLNLRELVDAVAKVMEAHHKKEMGIFPSLTDHQGASKKDLVDVLIQEHDLGYEYLANIIHIIEQEDNNQEEKYDLLPFHLEKYAALLDEHIKKEEKNLFPMIAGSISEDKQPEIRKIFKRIDQEYNNRRQLFIVSEGKRQYK